MEQELSITPISSLWLRIEMEKRYSSILFFFYVLMIRDDDNFRMKKI